MNGPFRHLGDIIDDVLCVAGLLLLLALLPLGLVLWWVWSLVMRGLARAEQEGWL